MRTRVAMARRIAGRSAYDPGRPQYQTIHRPPGMPMQLDGKDEPDAILREYEGQPLQIVADRDALLGKRVQIFTSRERAEDYAHKVDAEAGWAPPDAAGQSVPLDPPPPGQGFLQLYDGFSFATPTWRILEWERSSGNLRNFWAVLWFPIFMNADNAVSSVDSYLSARWLLLFDLPDLQGTTLWLPGVTWAPNLTMFGFHDRASSFLMLYF